MAAHGAPVAELVDAADSKSVVRKDVGVRVSLGAPIISMGYMIPSSMVIRGYRERVSNG